MLSYDDVDINTQDELGLTPLSHAAENGHENVVRLLLGRPTIEPDKADFENRTPLAYAAGGGHEGVMRLLLDWMGAKVDQRDHGAGL